MKTKSIVLYVLLIFSLAFNFSCKKKNDDECPVCPTITSISPTHAKWGQTVTIYGNNFNTNTTANIIKINGHLIPSDSIVSGNSSQIVVRIPKGVGTGSVTVDVDNDLTFTGTAPIFTYDYTVMVSTYAGGGAGLPFNVLRGLTIDPSGIMYVTDAGLHQVFKIVGGVPSVFAGSGVQGHDDGTLLSSTFDYMRAIKSSPSGNLYIVDDNVFALRRINPGLGTVTSIAGSPTISGDVDGSNSTARIEGVCGLMVSNNSIYMSQCGFPSKIRLATEINLYTCDVTTITKGGYGHLDGPDSIARVTTPGGLAFDASQNLFWVECWTNCVRKRSNGNVSTIAGLGDSGQPGSWLDGVGTNARFNNPMDIALAPDGNLAISDYDNHCIRLLNPNTRQVRTIAGHGGVFGYHDGIGDSALFNHPYGIAFDNQGVLYVADAANYVIRKVIIE